MCLLGFYSPAPQTVRRRRWILLYFFELREGIFCKLRFACPLVISREQIIGVAVTRIELDRLHQLLLHLECRAVAEERFCVVVPRVWRRRVVADGAIKPSDPAVVIAIIDQHPPKVGVWPRVP